MRVMRDTNVVISIALFASPGMDAVKAALERDRVVLCDFVVDELREVFARKFPGRIDDLECFLAGLRFDRADTVWSLPGLPDVRDGADIPVLASAVSSGVDILLTGDKDLTTLDLVRPRILTPSEYAGLVRHAGQASSGRPHSRSRSAGPFGG